MTSTTGFQIGPETNNTIISYAVESTWGTKPAVAFQNIRYVSETLAHSKSRQRPSEINSTREATAGVTTQESAGGAINYALSYGTFDDFIAVLLGSDWSNVLAVAGVSGDIALTNTSATTATLISTTSGKFTDVSAGQWIKLSGFTNTANNGYYRVATKVSALSLILTTLVATVTETPSGTAAQVRGSTIRNGTSFKSLYIQQKLASAQYLVHPGSYVTGMTISGGVGQFFNGGFTIIAQQQTSATSEGSTGAALAAPTGKVFDTVGGFGGIYYNEASFGAIVDSFSLNLQNTSAAPEYGLGSAAAAGLLAGTFTGTGTMKVYFQDFVNYARFRAETAGTLEFIMKDAAGNAYVISVLNCIFSTGALEVGGPGTAVMANFGIEMNPQAGSSGTIQIDRINV